jgi:hypothetical protein
VLHKPDKLISYRHPGAPFAFGEKDLRERVGAYKRPAHWPQLAIEQRVKNDIQGLGGIDYCFLSSSSSKPDISDVLATCEVKGPKRHALFLRRPPKTGILLSSEISESKLEGRRKRRMHNTIWD